MPIEEVAPLSYGLMFASGELIAASLFSHLLNTLAVPAQPFWGHTAGIHTDADARNAAILSVDPDPIRQCLAKGSVAVVAGGQGRCSWTNEITSLGRGGSDTTAVALAAGLKADRLELFKDVPGISAADPRLLPAAPTLHKVCYEQLREMARWGARVISPQAVDTAEKAGIPIRVDGVCPSAGAGTIVSSEAGEHGWGAVVSTGPIRSVWRSERSLVGDAAYGRVIAPLSGESAASALAAGHPACSAQAQGREEPLCWVSLLSGVERSADQRAEVRRLLRESGVRPRLSDEHPRRQTFVVECEDERRAAEALYAAWVMLSAG